MHFSLSARIFVDATGRIVNPLKVTSVDLRRDYMNRFGDELIVTMEILAGQYAREIYPHNDAIDITLTRAPMTEAADTADAGRAI